MVDGVQISIAGVDASMLPGITDLGWDEEKPRSVRPEKVAGNFQTPGCCLTLPLFPAVYKSSWRQLVSLYSLSSSDSFSL